MRRKRQFLAGLAGAFAMLALPLICQAKTITVYSLVDPGNPSTCALRDAITAANTKKAVNGCNAGSGSDTIVFGRGLSGTIPLENTLPAIVNTLTIQGTATSPPAITISGQGAVGLLQVNSGATLNLNYLILTDGFSTGDGSGILNNGTLNVANSTLSDNGSVTGFGGAIYNHGTLTVANSTLSDNIAYDGGGILSQTGAATVINSTFADNNAPGSAGGAIYVATGTLTVVNSTLADNTALSFGAGIGVTPGAAVDLSGTILAANLASSIPSNCSGTTDEGYNLSDDDSCDFSASGSENNVSDTDLALVTPPASNGGPTDTIALGNTSVALNAIPVTPTNECLYQNVNPCNNPPTISSGSSGPLVCDQRGVPRPQGSACDVGAFEYQALTDFADFSTGLIVFPLQFAAGGSFTLAPGAVFDPPTEAVTMTISSASFPALTVTIPPGSFTLNAKGQYKYSGTIGGINYGITILAPVDGVYQFTFAAFGLDLTGIANPVSVTLQIGPNIGTDDSVAAAIL